MSQLRKAHRIFFGDTLKVRSFILQSKDAIKKKNKSRRFPFFFIFTFSLSHHKNGKTQFTMKIFLEPLRNE